MDLWKFLSEKRIEDAQDSGELNTAASQGQPLDLSENPYVPESQRLAFKLMKDNDLVPAWVADGKEIREAISSSTRQLERAQAQLQKTLQHLDARVDVDSIYARLDAYRTWDDACERFRKAGARINRLINTYNLRVPISDLQRLYFNVDRELERIEKAGKRQ